MENKAASDQAKNTTPPPLAGLSKAGDIVERLTTTLAVDEAALAEREHAEAERSQAIRNADRSRRWQSLVGQFGQRYSAATFESFEAKYEQQRHVRDKLREYAADIDTAINAGRNIVLYGPPGTGKDHLVVATMKAAVAAHYTVEWRDAQSLYGSFRDAIGADKSEHSVIDALTRASVLAISDPTPPLGELSDYQRSMLFRIVDRRYRDLRPTWVTINAADSAEAERKIAPNIIDRLAHGALVLRCNWPSYRRVQ